MKIVNHWKRILDKYFKEDTVPKCYKCGSKGTAENPIVVFAENEFCSLAGCMKCHKETKR